MWNSWKTKQTNPSNFIEGHNKITHFKISPIGKMTIFLTELVTSVPSFPYPSLPEEFSSSSFTSENVLKKMYWRSTGPFTRDAQPAMLKRPTLNCPHAQASTLNRPWRFFLAFIASEPIRNCRRFWLMTFLMLLTLLITMEVPRSTKRVPFVN